MLGCADPARVEQIILPVRALLRSYEVWDNWFDRVRGTDDSSVVRGKAMMLKKPTNIPAPSVIHADRDGTKLL